MTVTAKTLVEGQIIPASNTTVYTTPLSVTTIIDKCTTTNYTSGVTVISISIVAAGNSVSDAYYIGKKTLAAYETYIWPEVVGHILNSGDYVSAISGGATGTNFRMSGREVTQ